MSSNHQTLRGNALAIHGAGGGGWEWAIWQRVWQACGMTLQAPDLDPAGGDIAATTLHDYIAQMQEAAGRLHRPVLLGASLGGLIALAIAARADAAALVLVNPLPPLGVSPRPCGRAYVGDIVPWGRCRRLTSTQRALPNADAAAVLYALRRWRDESAAVMRAATAGHAIDIPSCPVLVIASDEDADIAPVASSALAASLGAEFWRCRQAGHVDPLLGRGAAGLAARTAAWALAASAVTPPSQASLQAE